MKNFNENKFCLSIDESSPFQKTLFIPLCLSAL